MSAREEYDDEPDEDTDEPDTSHLGAAGLAVCDMPHGHSDNSAEVYGHFGWPKRTCIRLAHSRVWVYSTGWEVDR